MAFSCRQRCCCPSCDQKHALLPGHRLAEEVFAAVPHRQWVLTTPKRLRIYFRYDRRLLGKLCRLAYESIREGSQEACGEPDAVPGMVGAIQTFGDLIGGHAHVHAIVSEGVFRDDGAFVSVPELDMAGCLARWQESVFELLLSEEKISQEMVESMRQWRHSGFSIDNSVRIGAEDPAGMQRLISYIARCPFSLARMIKVTEEAKVIYRAGKSRCVRFPEPGDERLKAGLSRNFPVFAPLAFLTEVTQHIPDKGQHQIHYFGFYSNKQRGMRQKREAAAEQRRGGGESEEDSAVSKQRPEEVLAIEEPCLDYGFFDRVCI